MPSFYAIKLRLSCPECGESSSIDGPWAQLRCVHCGSTTSIAYVWSKILGRAMEREAKPTFQAAYYLDTSMPISGFQYMYAAGMPPTCPCGVALDVAAIASGTEGTFACTACGEQHATFPAPVTLSRKIQQVFLAVREEDQGVEPATAAARPVMFACASCGGTLKITTETRRIVTCEFCDVDQFLPAVLWHQLHPVRKRRVFWLRSG
jgi:hypothetical protein